MSCWSLLAVLIVTTAVATYLASELSGMAEKKEELKQGSDWSSRKRMQDDHDKGKK